jgi:transposase InsO family protein
MVDAGISYRHQSEIFGIPHQTLHARRSVSESVPRSRSVDSDEHHLVDAVHVVKAEHPSWGIRRVRAFIRKKYGIPVGRKRTARIMRSHNLLCSRIKKRVHQRSVPRVTATRINQLWATDMTSFQLTTGQNVFLVVVMDIFTRRIVGWHADLRCRAIEWLQALNLALNAEFPDGVRGHDLTLRMDNGCQPTSRLYQNTLSTCGILGEWVGFNSPEQNGHVESLIGTLKQDWLWLHECESIDEARSLCSSAVSEYNADHPHSSLGMWSPNEFTDLVRKDLVRITNSNSIEILISAA